MNHDATHITFILDRSGSMEPLADTAISGFNNLLAENASIPGRTTMSVVLFNSNYEVTAAFTPIAEIVPLNCATYSPDGGTALLDAMARAIDETGAHLAALPEDQRPGKVIIATLTDGEENSSRACTWNDVRRRITHQTDVYKWTFLFLGANQDAIATAAAIGIDRGSALTFASAQDTTSAAFRILDSAITAVRLGTRPGRPVFTDDDRQAAMRETTPGSTTPDTDPAAPRQRSAPAAKPRKPRHTPRKRP